MFLGRCQQTPCPEIGSRHRCTPSTARVRLPVSLCHIANSKNARELNASHNRLRRVKLRTVNSHFATLPVRHRASGMYLRSIYSVITDGQRLADVTTAHLRTSRRLTVAAASLPSCCDGTPSCHHPMNGSATFKPGMPFGSKSPRRTGLLPNAASDSALKNGPGRRARHLWTAMMGR
jgi:hypothetical protein